MPCTCFASSLTSGFLALQATPLSETATESYLLSESLEAALQTPHHLSSNNLQLQWEQWLAYFELSDASAERKEELQSELKDAIVGERYARASQLKSELLDLESRDSVASVLAQLSSCLTEERYSEAARIRDEGLTQMSGWWAGQAPDDPIGHLLHVTQEYNRWTGRVFRPRDIAAMKNKDKTAMMPRLGRSSSSSSLSLSLGSPVLEVFLRPADQIEQPSSDTQDLMNGLQSIPSLSPPPRYLQQAVSLRLPTMEEIDRRRSSATLTPLSLNKLYGSSPGPMAPSSFYEDPSRMERSESSSYTAVRLSVSIFNDGTASIRPLPPFFTSPSPSHNLAGNNLAGNSSRSSLPMSAPDEQAVLRTLRWPSTKDSQPTISPSLSTTNNNSNSSSSHPTISSNEEGTIDIHSQASIDHDSESNDLQGLQGLPSSSGLVYDDDEDGIISTTHDSFSELLRTPARIELLGRDTMAFHIPEVRPMHPKNHASVSSSRASSSQWGGSQWGGSTSSSFLAPAQRLKAAESPLHSSSDTPEESGKASSSSSEEEGVASRFEVVIPIRTPFQGPSPQVPPSSSINTGGAIRGVNQAGSGTINARLARAFLTSSRENSPQDPPPPSSPLPADELLSVLAAQVAQSMEAKAGSAAPPLSEIAHVIKEVVRRVMSGEEAASVEVRLSPSGSIGGNVEVVEQPIASEPEEVTSVLYKRIQSDKVKTDPLSGLYLGSFGPHGPELLRLDRKIVDGEEVVEALKLTGDANVPAGYVSFRAKVSRKHKLEAREVYPDELGISARYRGEGRVAQKGFKEPRWVEGELLVFSAKGSPVTAGATLGFVWSVPGEKRFLILLNRIALE